MARENDIPEKKVSRRSAITGAVGTGVVAFGTDVVVADENDREDLAAAFDKLRNRYGTPRERGTTVLNNGESVYTHGNAPTSPPRSIGTPAIGTAYTFGDGFKAEYWCSLKPSNNKWRAYINDEDYRLQFTETDQSKLSKKMEAVDTLTAPPDTVASTTADIQLTEGVDQTVSLNQLHGGYTYNSIIPAGNTNEDVNLDAREGYADAKVFAGGQAESIAEIWTTVSSNSPGGVDFELGGTWSGSMIASPGTSSKGKVSVFVREAGSEQDIDKGNILTHTAPVYGDYWQRKSSYKSWNGDNTVFAQLDSGKVYDVGVRLKCTSSALDVSGPLPGTVRSDFYKKTEPIDPTQNRKFASLDKVEISWPNI